MDVYFQKKFNGSRVFDLSYFSFTSLTNVSAFSGACNIQTVMQKQASFLTYLNTHTHTHTQHTKLQTIKLQLFLLWGFFGASVERTHLQCRRHEFDLQVGKILWRRKWQAKPIFQPGKCHGRRSLGLPKSETQLSVKQQNL